MSFNGPSELDKIWKRIRPKLREEGIECSESSTSSARTSAWVHEQNQRPKKDRDCHNAGATGSSYEQTQHCGWGMNDEKVDNEGSNEERQMDNEMDTVMKEDGVTN
jgi:hypothetical protein